MMTPHVVPSLIWCLLTLTTQDGVEATKGTVGSTQDPSSYSNVDQFRPTHISFDFAVDFADSSTYGTVTHSLTVLESGITSVFFDVWDQVEVYQVEYLAPGGDPTTEYADVPFNITTPNPNIGNALEVQLTSSDEVPLTIGQSLKIRFTYKSLAGTTALSWLTPAQTASKKHPFVYSLCQMNFCRDWAPMMDTPSQKITYDSTVVAPSELVVSMSGNRTGAVTLNATHTITTFRCDRLIPSYQLALIVGDLEMRALSDRVYVFAEAPYIDAAVAEFEDIPSILDSTEAYLTPYIWGDYSIFVMPPSFPWGVSIRRTIMHSLVTHARPCPRPSRAIPVGIYFLPFYLFILFIHFLFVW